MCIRDSMTSRMCLHVGAFLSGPGASEEAIVQQAKMYGAYKEDVSSGQTRAKWWWYPHI